MEQRRMHTPDRCRINHGWTLVLLLLANFSRPAVARAAGPGLADPVTEARLLCEEARALRDQGRLRGALVRYERAYQLVPTPVILLEEARLYLDLDEPWAGLELVRRIDASVLPPRQRRDHAQLRRQLASRVANTAARPPAARPERREGRGAPAAPTGPPRAPGPSGPAGPAGPSGPSAPPGSSGTDRRGPPAPAAPPSSVPPLLQARSGGPGQRIAGQGLGLGISQDARLPGVRQRLRLAGWAVGGVGLATAVAGAVLWALDGSQACQLGPGQEECPRLRDTRALGIGLVAIGGAAVGTSALMVGLDYRQPGPDRGGGHRAVITVAGGF